MATTGHLPHPTNDWLLLQDKFYRKHTMYELCWRNIQLDKFKIAAAPFGGPLALIRDDKKLLVANQQQTTDLSIYLYSSSGKLLGQIECDGFRVVAMDWNSQEQLVCVLNDGTVRTYSLDGEYRQFSLGQVAKETSVIDCRFWGNGLIALTGSFKLIAVNSMQEPRPRMLADPGLSAPPCSWTVIPPHMTLSRHVEVYLATQSTVLIVDSKDVQDQLVHEGPIRTMSVSPNGKFLGLHLDDGRVWVVSSDFQNKLSEYHIDATYSSPPHQLVWCGTDAVCLSIENTLTLVGPFGDNLSFPYFGPIHLIQEIDGVRVISDEKCEFFHKVPASTEDVFSIGSTSPAAMLYDAYEFYERRNPKADENVRNIKPELAGAVDRLIEAAGEELNADQQRALLKAASFGKSFLDLYNGNKLVDMCRLLRVLNAFRGSDVGIPLTYRQFCALNADEWVDRLIHRRLHLLAMRMCKYLALNPDRVYVNWACAKIKAATHDEDTLYRVILEKLGGKLSLSFAEIAHTASHLGYEKLAAKLLEHEPRAADQVPLLISMGKDQLALRKAVESGDADLMYYVLLYLYKQYALGDFFRVISHSPQATALIKTFFRQDPQPDQHQQSWQVLRDFYYQEDCRLDAAHLDLQESLKETDPHGQMAKIRSAVALLHEDKDRGFEAKICEDQIKLVKLQLDLEQLAGRSFRGLSISETAYQCVIQGLGSKAAQLRNDFKIPDKRFWFIKLRTLVAKRDWTELEKFSRVKKSPIGYDPFVSECIQALNPREALRYIPKCDAQARPGWYLAVGEYGEAGKAAFAIKDADTLTEARKQARNQVTIAELDQLLAQLKVK
ncbi:Vps16, N-terminal region-domain-containing protein [Dimargaris cristalligena]|uniref:Probable vacuolar protein sorting-associated protein 16 homolog n=1 Tax=Dimargaris cristalligena TaxID=215637 RepID=A0A4P9ZW49_9FUNG|nr:Vps16, N-terminal region-domain-containing protein [Dimargaris cristalligena]|eukprot:RKP37876.1 Vps16, N-terminal region-domain-containing protein [Dimargaris cristalligena]